MMKKRVQYNTAVGLTKRLDRLIDHLINNHDDPAKDIRPLRKAAAHCNEYADELEQQTQTN